MSVFSACHLRRLTALVLCAAPPGCAPPPPDDPEPDYEPVYLVGRERLEAPAISTEDDVYRPAYSFDIDEHDPQRGQAVGFFLTLATSRAQDLTMRLFDPELQLATALLPVPPPATDWERASAAEPRTFNAATREPLATGTGVYWLDYSDVNGLEHRFAVLVPQSALSAGPRRLELFTSVADDGTALGAAQLELAEDFFYLVIIGDSIMWGNGLEEADKMSARATVVIERETRRKVIQQRYAHTGARIVPAEGDAICETNCTGEVPTASTSITVQADLIERPELVDLILMDGCINDVQVATIINPDTSAEQLVELTQQFCDQEMVTLLRKVRGLAPQAPIVVTGYFQIVGPESDLFALQTWLRTLGAEPLDPEESVIGKLTLQSTTFHSSAHESLRAAIDQVNAEGEGAPMIAFADPGFGPRNAIFAPEEWLWSLTSQSELIEELELGLELFPEDPLLNFRLLNCLKPDVIDRPIACIYSSVGHPNPTGAQVYADAIVNCLRDLGVLPSAGE